MIHGCAGRAFTWCPSPQRTSPTNAQRIAARTLLSPQVLDPPNPCACWVRHSACHHFGRTVCKSAQKAAMETLIQDIRFAFRTFVGNPGFACIAIVTLALGIGANTAIFTILDSVLLRTLPVNNPQQLVALTDPDAHGMSNGSESGNRRLLAYSEFEYLRDHNEVFSDIFASDSAVEELPVTIANGTESANSGDAAASAALVAHDSARIRLVSGDYFQ